MRKSKKLLSLALASLMTVSSFACLGTVNAFAAEGDPQPQVLKGDVNKDGVVDVEDATLIQLYAVDDPKTLAKFESGEYSAEAADVDGSGAIDITDATLVQIIATEPTTTAPVETTSPVEPTTEPEETTVAPTTEPAEDIYVLAGTSDWLTVGWDPAVDAYVMEKQEDGTYAITVPDVPAGDANFALKVVRFVGGDEAQKEWYGVNGGNLNYDFMVKEVCDVKVTFNPETKEIAVTGDSVAEPEYPINKIVAVGSGQNGFLNDEAWAVDSENNKMTEKSEGVYEIVYDEVEANAEYQVKFAANGSWNMNWGLVSGTEVVLNEANPAQYNAQDNIVFMPESEDEYVKITLTLDLSKWDKITKEGATYTIKVEPVGEEPTTVEPTTEPAEPTTVEPTTAEPTTVEPTTEPAPAEDVYVLAGSSDWLSVGWDPAIDAFVMEKQEDGTYAITVEGVEASDANYALKVVKFVGGDEAQKEWFGVNGGNLNYDFMVKEACDVTVTFNPETKEITVTGTGVADPEYPINKIVAVGSGQNGFLNDEAWAVDSEANTMTDKGDGVYEIVYDEVEANAEYQVKFAANGSWGMNWGLVKGTEAALNAPNPAQYNAEDNIVFMPESEDEYVKITLTLDLSKWDKITKEGATYTIKVEAVEEPTTAEPTTVEPTTAEPTTAEPTTAEPTTVEPTTAEPTTAEPTTAEPTTVEPTTAEPTTVEPTTAPAEDVYVLAGSSDWLTVGWEPAVDAYAMEKQEDGTYAITVEGVEASDANYALKVVKFVGGDEAQKEWFGVNGGNLNYDFMVKEACDVTVTFNPETKEITVTGTGVADPEYPINKIVAVGSGQNGFLNDESWAVDSEANTMTDKGEGVYEIVYDEVEANVEYQVKFAANGSWGMNWGLVSGTEVVLNEANPAQYNAQDNIVFMPESEDEYVKITLTLDLSKWDKITKEGATYTIKVEPVEEY